MQADSPAPGDIRAAVLARLSWRLVPFLFLLYVVAYLDRINVGFAALQMQGQLHFSDAVYGLGAGMFFAGYLLFQVPSNLVLEHIGARRWISSLMISWGVISASMVLVTTARSFYVLRFLLGIAESGFFPGIILYLGHWFPAPARARNLALFMTAGPISAVIGGPLSGRILELQNRAGLAGWQWLFLLEGLPAVLLGIVAMSYLTDRPAAAHWLSEEHRAWLMDELRREQTALAGVVRTEIRSIFSDARIWLLAIVYLGLALASYGISFWLPTVIRGLAVKRTFMIGLLFTIPYMCGVVTMVLTGLHSDRSGERRWHVSIAALASSVGLFSAAYSTSIVSTMMAFSLAVLGINAMLGPFWALPTTMLGGAAAAAGIAMINTIGNLGGFLGPYVIGILKTRSGGFRSSLLLLSAGMLTSSVGTLLVRLRPESPGGDS
jgi:ACS family tartrate transporter-like MFS transporter